MPAVDRRFYQIQCAYIGFVRAHGGKAGMFCDVYVYGTAVALVSNYCKKT